MDTIQAYLGMGGYGAFIWPAFALSIAVLAGVLIHSQRAFKRSEAELARAGVSNIVEEETPA